MLIDLVTEYFVKLFQQVKTTLGQAEYLTKKELTFALPLLDNGHRVY
ncbi:MULTISPECIES: hypothetical protein [unclassified Gilliamella]|nr:MULTISPECIES: hypothetical protein [unclassified Gilliamella]MCX8641753.1 hypothetical protein [Gilliamella sp. B3835]MCX8706554.1 hypothetical protein [Gilliamella sp. B3783]MCX8708976.1 hypothetical protein [Gilliamella sp. B3780]MCX8714476.1 hypothetical protein [Gilliamella sp. B3781]MCX8715842.1 hypothetical protein [Gilliamella sp. B3784]